MYTDSGGRKKSASSMIVLYTNSRKKNSSTIKTTKQITNTYVNDDLPGGIKWYPSKVVMLIILEDKITVTTIESNGRHLLSVSETRSKNRPLRS